MRSMIRLAFLPLLVLLVPCARTADERLPGMLTGDGFPSAIVSTLDETRRTSTMIEYKTPYGPNEGPFLMLWGESGRPMGAF